MGPEPPLLHLLLPCLGDRCGNKWSVCSCGIWVVVDDAGDGCSLSYGCDDVGICGGVLCVTVGARGCGLSSAIQDARGVCEQYVNVDVDDDDDDCCDGGDDDGDGSQRCLQHRQGPH